MPGGVPSVYASHGRGPSIPMGFYNETRKPSRYSISGITKDSVGASLGNVMVDVYDTQTNTKRATIMSDSLGAYSIEVSGQLGYTFYVVAYKAGAPDVAGTTLNTLTQVVA